MAPEPSELLRVWCPVLAWGPLGAGVLTGGEQGPVLGAGGWPSPHPHSCLPQRFTSKQDVIRHYNMHKKRDNSLQHGFMRFSPLDDCSVYYHGCHLNGKSTHYHCMQVPLALPGQGGQGGGAVGDTASGEGPPCLLARHGGRRRGQWLAGQGGAVPMAILGAGEIQGAVYTDRHFSGFNTKSRIANGS